MVDSFAIQRVSSAATLRDVPVSLTRSIWLESYYGDGLGGGGYFRGLTGAAPGTYVDNGGTKFVPTGGDGSSVWDRIVNRSIASADFGTKGDGVTDDTARLKAAFDFAIANDFVLILSGSYLVSGPLTDLNLLASGSLRICCSGPVEITVDPGATAFTTLIQAITTAAADAEISGGPLIIDLNERCASGIDVRHSGSGKKVVFSSVIEIRNAKQNDAAATAENAGIIVVGAYDIITLFQPKVVSVKRLNAGGGACSGIIVTGLSGELYIYAPYIEQVLAPVGGVDADGIKVFGTNNAEVPPVETGGHCVIEDPVFVDCQGRSFKSQCSDTTLVRPRVERQAIVSITDGVDFDFQRGNGRVVDPHFRYKLNGAVSPLGTSFSPVVFDPGLSDAPSISMCVGGSLETEVSIPRFGLLSSDSDGLATQVGFYGLQIETLGAFAGPVFSRAFLETNMATVEAKSAPTIMVVRDNHGPIGAPLIGYTSYVSGALAAKLSYEIVDNDNTYLTGAVKNVFTAVSGNNIVDFLSILIRNNSGVMPLIAGVGGAPIQIDFSKLPAGLEFILERTNATITNGPATAVTYLLVRVETQFTPFATKTISARELTNTNPKLYITSDGGTNWQSATFT